MSVISRSIVVDDNDSGIIYSGPWFEDSSGDLNPLGNWGVPVMGTLHGTRSNASFMYTFNGTSFTVSTSNQFVNPTGLNIRCTLDGQSVPVSIPTSPINNALLCSAGPFADTQHTFVLDATVTNEETFWFDTLTYVPSPSTILDNFLLSFHQDDGGLRSGLGAGWNAFSPLGFQTSQNGTQYTFSFTGVSLTWYGFYDPSLPWDTSIKTATYSIDGGPSIAFNTLVDSVSISAKPGVRYNQLLFQTDDLAAGNHNLSVTYHGATSNTPLTLEYLLVNPNSRSVTAASSSVATSSVATSSAATSSPSLPTSTNMTMPLLPSSPPSPRKSSKTGAIAGSIAAIVACFAAMVIAFVLLKRRHRDRTRAPPTVDPFMNSSGVGVPEVVSYHPDSLSVHHTGITVAETKFSAHSREFRSSNIPPVQNRKGPNLTHAMRPGPVARDEIGGIPDQAHTPEGSAARRRLDMFPPAYSELGD